MTAIELMPVHQFVQDGHLQERGLSNYWGYNTIGFFAPHNAYAAGGTRGQQVPEFKTMVKALHEADIEVILDVVYNHTAEGNQFGPTLSFRGIDNAAYYRLVDADKRHYYDTTGTGNSLLMRHPHVLQLIMDSLRYWVTEMHVDGFRFDLAATLARQFHEVDRLSAFFDLVQQDPVVTQVKLIAEPWDVGDGGYQVGNFPPLWTEWNGKYRDTVRDFWRGETSTLAEFASRLTGSSDLYQDDGRRPLASINFVTAHDGFTLRDLVSYNDKHNEANGEGGKDGESHNRSWNCGVEGETDDAEVLELRARQQRNFLTTLLLSQGVPMIAHGDELGRTQTGNNNVYCQDNEIAWVDWKLDRLAEGPARVHPLDWSRCATTTRCSAAAASSTATPASDGLGDLAWFTPRAPRCRTATGPRRRPGGRGVPQRRRHLRAGPARRAGRGRLVPDPAQRQPRAAGLPAPARGVRRDLDSGRGHVDRAGRCRRGATCGRQHDPARGPEHAGPDPPAAGRRMSSVPQATYRLQLQPGSGSTTPPTVVPYLHSLGVSHVYLSPILQAAPGSTHGYDVVDHSRLSEPAGGGPAFDRLAARWRSPDGRGRRRRAEPHGGADAGSAQRRRCGRCCGTGPGSPYADWFDVDWGSGNQPLLMPVLGQRIGKVLADGELTVDSAATSRAALLRPRVPVAAGDRGPAARRAGRPSSGTGWRTGGSPTRS